MVSKLAPNSTHLTSGLVKHIPGRGCFRAVPSQNGDQIVTSPPPPQSLNGSESCATKKFSIFPLLSSTIFDPDANSVLLRAHLCTAVNSMRRKPCVRICSRKREGLFNGKVQQNPLCAASCVTKDIHISPRFSPAFFYRDANSVLLRAIAHLCTAVLIRSMRRTLCSKLLMMRA